jgi:hypothetical protein
MGVGQEIRCSLKHLDAISSLKLFRHGVGSPNCGWSGSQFIRFHDSQSAPVRDKDTCCPNAKTTNNTLQPVQNELDCLLTRIPCTPNIPLLGTVVRDAFHAQNNDSRAPRPWNRCAVMYLLAQILTLLQHQTFT